jgi:hypothetical protein
MLASLANAIVLRGCGYRLVRRPRGAAQSPQVVEAETVIPQWQFAWTLGYLAAGAIALACYAPSRLAKWEQAAETRY